MSYKKYFKLSQEFSLALKNYVIERNQVNNHYHTAKILLSEMNEKAYRDKEYLKVAFKWLNNGKTLALKDALSFTSYKSDDLDQLNSFLLLDSVSASL